MVLQQGRSLPIWGWADPGEEITVLLLDQRHTTRAGKDGCWQVHFSPLRSGGPIEMTVRGKQTLELNDILVGEVRLCSGQSNMEFRLSSTTQAGTDIPGAQYPRIRLFKVPKESSLEPIVDTRAAWEVCTPETAADFSAVAYFFGRELHRNLQVPVGLIASSWGGTNAEEWTSREFLERESEFIPATPDWKLVTLLFRELRQACWGVQMPFTPDALNGLLLEVLPAPIPPPRPPTGLFNGMIQPLLPYAIRGVVWYQGEGNAGRAYQYRKLLPALIQSWRQAWGQKDLSFLIVQLPNFRKSEAVPEESDWAELREAQLMALELPHTGLAVTIDQGEAANVHPRSKAEVGRRLALWALGTTYGRPLAYSGPLYQSMERHGNRLRLHFTQAGSGLMARGGAPMMGFSVAGIDRQFHWAQAMIEEESVLVWSDQVHNPVAARYAWANNPQCNLYNQEGLPASPFRTDQWPGVTFNKR